eukprot:COSAG02_NODE_5104_length_4627_cov_3.621466_6_plen_93_part_00
MRGRYGPRAAAVMAELEPDVRALSNPLHPPRTSSEVEFLRLSHDFTASHDFMASPLEHVPELDLGEGVHSPGDCSRIVDVATQPLPHSVGDS